METPHRHVGSYYGLVEGPGKEILLHQHVSTPERSRPRPIPFFCSQVERATGPLKRARSERRKRLQPQSCPLPGGRTFQSAPRHPSPRTRASLRAPPSTPRRNIRLKTRETDRHSGWRPPMPASLPVGPDRLSSTYVRDAEERCKRPIHFGPLPARQARGADREAARRLGDVARRSMTHAEAEAFVKRHAGTWDGPISGADLLKLTRGA